MLTTEDVNVIKNIIQTAIDPLAKDIHGVKQDVKGLKEDVSGIKQDVGILKQDVREIKISHRKLEKTVSIAIKMFDANDVRLKKRVTNIEKRLQVS